MFLNGKSLLSNENKDAKVENLLLINCKYVTQDWVILVFTFAVNVQLCHSTKL